MAETVDSVGYVDVQNMIRDACDEIDREIARALSDCRSAIAELRAFLKDAGGHSVRA